MRLLRVASLIVLLCLVSVEARVPWQDRIRRIIVLMEENRSYDHLMGWYNKSKTRLTGSEFNWVNASNHSQGKVFVRPHAPYINDCDPNHGYPATTYKIFGPEAYKANNFTTPTMSGFVQWEADIDGWSNPVDEYCNVMDGFAPSQLPVFYSLVENYVAFDQFFCSVPGPTWPNRLFFLGATSKGQTETIPWYKDQMGRLYPMRTIFDQITDAGEGTWKYYYEDTPWELFVESLAHSPEHTFNIESFFRDAREGTLPNFAFINPRAGINMTTGRGSNDMHPDHDVALSEALYKEIYEALRASPQWNETLFILTFDEHGGFYDHEKPHFNVPPPGDFNFPSYPDNFTFNRGGIRIPTVLISPWLPGGFIESQPPLSQRPQPNSGYELTSIMATVRKLLPFLNETGPLTQRDAWAATFEHLFDILEEPRTDCPLTLPQPPPAATLPPGMGKEHERPVNSLQTHMMTVNAHLAGVEYPSHIRYQGEVSEWLQTHYHKHRDATLEWKRSKVSHPESTSLNFSLRLAPYIDPKSINCTWQVERNASRVPFDTVWMTMYGRNYCLDLPRSPVHAGDVVGLSLCYPSTQPWNNRDETQHWYYRQDYTIRPKLDQSLCVTTSWVDDGSTRLRVEKCGDADSNVAVSQSFAFMGTAPGMSGGDGPSVGTHHIYFGDDLALWCTMPETD